MISQKKQEALWLFRKKLEALWLVRKKQEALPPKNLYCPKIAPILFTPPPKNLPLIVQKKARSAVIGQKEAGHPVIG